MRRFFHELGFSKTNLGGELRTRASDGFGDVRAAFART